ncbi:alpha-amylase AmyA [Aspergillus ellipticus CBS 707.79]|uniref:Alpha-amylase n=1 Tax=Aspergillus ellipticus CBS 707.79 TaxID=1448320 RepID=A0A319D0I1_9EURO|nr:alpha-amylase AmyA [Aspergillus ellipticus CBS 707.79]
MSLLLRYILGLCAISTLTPVFAADTGAWSSRSVYQTMTDRFARTDGSTTHPCNTTDGLYCGGTWRGMINQLDYIEGMGFDAVMISPVVKNIEGRASYGEAYHGYWPQDLYSLNPHFGTEQDLLDLSKAVHDRGMYLMMDTVINNMAYFTNGQDPSTSIDYSVLHPFNEAKYYHAYCPITDYNNYSLAQRCWTGDNIVALPDLKTEDLTVQTMLNDWVQEIMTNYSIDGLRLDAAKHVTPDFLPVFQKAAFNSFVTGEVFDQSIDTICSYQNDLTSVPNYPIYFALLDAFTKGNTTTLPDNIEIMKHSCPNVTTLTTFSENHDVARFASLESDINLAKNLLTFTILFDGIPMIYQGQEQHLSGPYDPKNREALWLTTYDTTAPLYKHISTLNAIRKHANQVDPNYLATQTYPVYRGSSEMGFRKGREGHQIITVLSTQGSKSGAYDITMMNGYQPGFVVMDIFTCRNYSTNDMGELRLGMDGGEPRVLFPVNLMNGSGLCGFVFSREDVRGNV